VFACEGSRGETVDISVFIPIFRESTQLEGMLDVLCSQNVSKEIFVTVDEPSPAFAQRLAKINREGVKIIVNRERTGKANACNETVKLSSGGILLFLDADVSLSADPDYLRKVIMEMQQTDILDIKKEVTKDKTFLSKMAYYEYLTFNMSAWLSSHFMKKCPAVNGAAFAIKREMFDKVHGFRKVVAEDIDLATRAFLAEGRFAYTQDVEVKNVVYNDWHKWYTQRRRWSIGQALWVLDWYKDLLRKFAKKPQVFLPSLFFLYPSVTIFALSALIPSVWMYNGVLVFSLFLSVKFNIALPLFMVSLATADLIKILIMSLAGFAITAAVFYGFGRKLGFHDMKLHELFLYYFFYSSLWWIFVIVGMVQAIGGRKSGPGWKT
jgi:cellulose synthase/poly-beta-1,6-N-acetylglucosamine synthase-like glycosyltransferase